jgi:hypothetical protein
MIGIRKQLKLIITYKLTYTTMTFQKKNVTSQSIIYYQ